MTYYQRYIKIMPTTNKKNYPLSRLLLNYTGDEYERLNFKGTYCGSSANNCVKDFSKSLYKYTDKFIQTDNVIKLNNYNDYIFKFKYDVDPTFIKNTLCDNTYEYNNELSCLSFYVNKTPPDPFDLFEFRQSNKYTITTDYSKSSKYEIFIGLYKFNDLTKDYDYLPNSFYDKKKQIYYLYEKI